MARLLSVITCYILIAISHAQKCQVICTQIATSRNLPYEEALLLAQNREWETSADFGGALKEIILQKYKDNRRVKRDGVTGFVEPIFSGGFGGGAAGPPGAGNFLEYILGGLRQAGPGGVANPIVTGGLFMTGEMIMESMLATTAAPPPDVVSPRSDTIVPLPGQAGGGYPPTIKNQLGANVRRIHKLLQSGAIPEILGSDIGPLVSIFDLQSPNLRAIAGIFEENSFRRKRSSRSLFDSIATYLVNGFTKFKRFAQRRQDTKKSYGVFVEIYLVENQECDRNYNAINTCSFYNEFSELIFKRTSDIYSFSNPICRTDSNCT